jgi:hypothetical protein
MADSATLDRIHASGLFDPDFYRKTYGVSLVGRKEALGYFLETGLARGHLPSAAFDPVLYRVIVPGCGTANPLLHALASGKPFEPPPLPEVFPYAATLISRKSIADELDGDRLRAGARDAARAREIAFHLEGRRYALKIPEPCTLMDRFRADRPFAYARLPHGFWDALWMIETAESAIAADALVQWIEPPQRRALATRLCAAARHSHGAFAPAFMDEVLDDIGAHAGHPDFFRAVSFKGQLVTDDEALLHYPSVPPQEEVMRLFASHFRPDEAIYDGTLWKRLLIAGSLGDLPGLCRDRPVVLVANRLFAKLGDRWRIGDFTHVRIPPRLSQWQRWDLLARTTEAIEAARTRSGRAPVVLTQCGGSLAFWLITRLFGRFPSAFYIDLGQALNGWFLDVLDVMKTPWMRLYARSIIENCKLEHFYRARKGANYDEWLRAFP